MKFKALLCCERTKPYLFNQNIYEFYESKYITSTHKFHEKQDYLLNGKILAECDFEVEEIKKVNYDCMLFTNTLDTEKLINKSCVSYFKLEEYLKPNWDKEDNLQNLDTVGYAIHIKNLHIFDESRELSEFDVINFKCIQNYYKPLENAPRNMMYVYDNGEKKILIPVSSEEMCRIANKEQTILVRKRVLKEVIK